MQAHYAVPLQAKACSGRCLQESLINKTERNAKRVECDANVEKKSMDDDESSLESFESLIAARY
jgi:hypothetical protein